MVANIVYYYCTLTTFKGDTSLLPIEYIQVIGCPGFLYTSHTPFGRIMSWYNVELEKLIPLAEGPNPPQTNLISP